jgi:hypothetical protein
MIHSLNRNLQVLISSTIMYASLFFIHVNKLIIVQERYTEELKKKHEPDIVPRSVPFDVDVVYAAGGGLQHERYVKRY